MDGVKMTPEDLESIIENLSKFGKREILLTLNPTELNNIVTAFTKYTKKQQIGINLTGVGGNIHSYQFLNITLHLKLSA